MSNSKGIMHSVPLYALPPMHVGIFFDGTGNNDDNPDKYSNVKYLYDMHLGDDQLLDNKNYTNRKFYQRGVGSHNDDFIFESTMGTGAGKRFENVIFHIEQFIIDYSEEFNNKVPKEINLNVFGFSRGAAMARHFVNCIKQDYFDFEDADINKSFSALNIKINFLGVFDTVGSFGIAGDNIDTGYSFYIDPSWIEKKAVHIYALNEYRWGFDLQAMMSNQDTNYPIDIIEDKLVEIGLPGVHSDIGGGYDMYKLEQFADNSLLACMALEKMAQYAIESNVTLGTDYKDSARRYVNYDNKNFSNMKASYDEILPFIENNDLRLAIGLWRESIALRDIYKENNPLPLTSENSVGRMGNAKKLRRNRIKSSLKQFNEKVNLSEQKLIALFESEENFNKFKSNYENLYLNYMHRSHSPFNTTLAMGKQDADENSSIWNRTLSDDRPHRDIFYNKYKNFEKVNNRRVANGYSRTNAPIEFYPIKSNFWDDETRA